MNCPRCSKQLETPRWVKSNERPVLQYVCSEDSCTLGIMYLIDSGENADHFKVNLYHTELEMLLLRNNLSA